MHVPCSIAVVGKYTGLGDSYLSVTKALMHSSIACDRKLKILWIEAEDLEEESKQANEDKYDEAWAKLKRADGERERERERESARARARATGLSRW